MIYTIHQGFFTTTCILHHRDKTASHWQTLRITKWHVGDTNWPHSEKRFQLLHKHIIQHKDSDANQAETLLRDDRKDAEI